MAHRLQFKTEAEGRSEVGEFYDTLVHFWAHERTEYFLELFNTFHMSSVSSNGCVHHLNSGIKIV